MSFLKRLFGGDGSTPAGSVTPVDPATALDEENARDRELMRDEAQRLDDELIQRQMRYADRAWTPPAQGGTRRSDDDEGDEPGER
jgi:hypothetical protein